QWNRLLHPQNLCPSGIFHPPKCPAPHTHHRLRQLPFHLSRHVPHRQSGPTKTPSHKPIGADPFPISSSHSPCSRIPLHSPSLRFLSHHLYRLLLYRLRSRDLGSHLRNLPPLHPCKSHRRHALSQLVEQCPRRPHLSLSLLSCRH